MALRTRVGVGVNRPGYLPPLPVVAAAAAAAAAAVVVVVVVVAGTALPTGRRVQCPGWR